MTNDEIERAEKFAVEAFKSMLHGKTTTITYYGVTYTGVIRSFESVSSYGMEELEIGWIIGGCEHGLYLSPCDATITTH